VITNFIIQRIRALYHEGRATHEIARIVGVSESTVRKYRNNKTQRKTVAWQSTYDKSRKERRAEYYQRRKQQKET
jgi:predicted transcriptional regulator